MNTRKTGSSAKVIGKGCSKRSYQKISIKKKMDVLAMYERGMKVTSIAREIELSEGTVRTIKRNKAKIKE